MLPIEVPIHNYFSGPENYNPVRVFKGLQALLDGSYNKGSQGFLQGFPKRDWYAYHTVPKMAWQVHRGLLQGTIWSA